MKTDIYNKYKKIAMEMQQDGYYFMPTLPKHFQLLEVREQLKNACEFCIMQLGKKAEDFEWTPEVEEVCKWLEDNDSKGLLMFGKCGRGKTFLARYVLPLIFKSYNIGILTYYDMTYAVRHTDEVLDNYLLVLDDLGTEQKFNDFGTVRDTVAEVIDKAEKNGMLLIITTNLNADELKSTYGERTFDRLLSLTHRVLFQGESFRK